MWGIYKTIEMQLFEYFWQNLSLSQAFMGTEARSRYCEWRFGVIALICFFTTHRKQFTVIYNAIASLLSRHSADVFFISFFDNFRKWKITIIRSSSINSQSDFRCTRVGQKSFDWWTNRFVWPTLFAMLCCIESDVTEFSAQNQKLRANCYVRLEPRCVFSLFLFGRVERISRSRSAESPLITNQKRKTRKKLKREFDAAIKHGRTRSYKRWRKKNNK